MYPTSIFAQSTRSGQHARWACLSNGAAASCLFRPRLRQQRGIVAPFARMNTSIISSYSSIRSLRRYRHFLDTPSLPADHIHVRSYSINEPNQPTADEYIVELQDLYEIAKDELEIAAESTDGATIYAASDRASLREAFDDLDRAYAQYTGAESVSPAQGGESTASLSSHIPSEVKEEIKRRVGQRIRELKNAVEALEEKSRAE
ncbi:hypothetical protein LOZ57_004704 [Ophidiomyces ophidiicola]|uniref:uncharacterized protein n=1 Tax=Ophidiomyces ophidiicola TaxID=1387563 RepID=UPI0020C2E576|nr:uncharacterized protein LOZ57_004704 [Ophidiomyces ophidiicola]KAI1944691.1 hypothetical protein LOZ57_004704 [Ophidiomyces ophidiicola]KAI2048065.1 hypothetical protein LOZ43_005471 [Ophidiomyces ophidiicola]